MEVVSIYRAVYTHDARQPAVQRLLQFAQPKGSAKITRCICTEVFLYHFSNDIKRYYKIIILQRHAV